MILLNYYFKSEKNKINEQTCKPSGINADTMGKKPQDHLVN